jgi:hypothetical protein
MVRSLVGGVARSLASMPHCIGAVLLRGEGRSGASADIGAQLFRLLARHGFEFRHALGQQSPVTQNRPEELRPHATIDAEGLREFALARIDERAAAPKRVIVLEQLPLTAVGKIHKPTLRAMAAREAVRELLSNGFPNLELEIAALQDAQGELQLTVSTSSAPQSLCDLCEELAGGLKLRPSSEFQRAFSLNRTLAYRRDRTLFVCDCYPA